ncbi:5-oxoprolinase subunit PxpB [Bacillus sp. 03113]|uniref:5-oxoprolinase subunit PxpB n=1 Tax=Bacillus sp. 03113 TaxID=2578211 RepID=UPI001141FD92|nr:5-oxoprolinase subunit PxpB [Bacillus sp. 03113]
MSQVIINNLSNIQITALGDSAIVIQLGNEISHEVHRKVMKLKNHFEKNLPDGFIECVPSFTNVTLYYDPVIIYNQHKQKKISSPFQIVQSIIKEELKNISDSQDFIHRTIEIPICYGGVYGPDLEDVAKHNGLTTDEVIAIHSTGEYLVYMIGFAPGFAFMGGMSDKIATPRRSTPRTSIPVGSVGIAGKQTGIYPISTPGGWQLIGKTPTPLFLPNEHPPSLLQAGDRVKFRSISQEEFLEELNRGRNQ